VTALSGRPKPEGKSELTG